MLMPLMPCDLLPFCDPNPWRYSIAKPFVQGGWWCATDGRILVCTPAYGHPESVPSTDHNGNPGKFPNCKELLGLIDKVEVWHEELPSLPTCPHCKGTGKKNQPCECSECDNKHVSEHDCDCHVEIGNCYLATKYLLKVLTLPGVKWGVVDPASEKGIIFLRFDGGGMGGVMPLDKKKTDEEKWHK